MPYIYIGYFYNWVANRFSVRASHICGSNNVCLAQFNLIKDQYREQNASEITKINLIRNVFC